MGNTEISTPDSLGLKLIVGDDSRHLYVLAHPYSEGRPVDVQLSLVIEVSSDAYRVARLFEKQIVSMVMCDGTLYCVDNRQQIHLYDGRTWTDVGNPPLTPFRINALKCVQDRVYGVADDGLIFLWEGRAWKPLSKKKTDLYLYEIVEWPGHGLIVCGENGFLATLADMKYGPIKTGTKDDLVSALALADGGLLVTGQEATALVLAKNKCTRLDAGDRDDIFYHSIRWQDRILIAAQSEILEYRDGKLQKFAPLPASRLCTSDQGKVLWRQSATGLSFTDDKEKWTDLPLKSASSSHRRWR